MTQPLEGWLARIVGAAAVAALLRRSDEEGLALGL